MVEIPSKIIELLKRQGFATVSVMDGEGGIYCSVKGLAAIEHPSKVSLIDLYEGKTAAYLKENSAISITVIDEHAFEGYTLRGTAVLLECGAVKQEILDQWEEMIMARISRRVIKNIKKEKGSPHHPESHFPKPKCLITVSVENIIDLAPAYLRQAV